MTSAICFSTDVVDDENAELVMYFSVDHNVMFTSVQSCEVTDLGQSKVTVNDETADDESTDEPNLSPVCFSELQYITVECEGLTESITALRDLGAEVSLIKKDLIKGLDLPILGTISMRGIFGEPVVANLVSLKVKPCPGHGYENIAPYLNIVFAACALTSEISMILCGTAVNQLDNLAAYNVVKPSVESKVDENQVIADLNEFMTFTKRQGHVDAQPELKSLNVTVDSERSFSNNWSLHLGHVQNF